MTDHSALIERLEAGCIFHPRHYWIVEPDKTDALLAEAAAALRDQQRRLDRWEPKPVCIGSVGVSYLVGGNNSPLPSAPNQAKEAGE